MSRRALLAAAGVAAVLFALTAAPAPARAPAPLFVDAREWSITLSRATVPAGPVAVQLHNAGEDDHDLRLRRLDRRGRTTGPTVAIAVTTPGTMTEARVDLRRGRWRVWCSLDGHARAGMQARLRAT